MRSESAVPLVLGIKAISGGRDAGATAGKTPTVKPLMAPKNSTSNECEDGTRMPKKMTL
jgi:hypothetical protein